MVIVSAVPAFAAKSSKDMSKCVSLGGQAYPKGEFMKVTCLFLSLSAQVILLCGCHWDNTDAGWRRLPTFAVCDLPKSDSPTRPFESLNKLS
jgi:hypothetical protein